MLNIRNNPSYATANIREMHLQLLSARTSVESSQPILYCILVSYQRH